MSDRNTVRDLINVNSNRLNELKRTVNDYNNRLETRLNDILEKWNIQRLHSWDLWEDIVDFIQDSMKSLFEGFTDTLSGWVQAIIDPIINTFNDIYVGITSAFTTVKDWLDTAITSVVDGFMGIIDWTANGLTAIWDSLKTSLVNFQSYVFEGVKNTWNGVVTGMENFGNNVLKGITDLFASVQKGLLSFADYFLTSLMNMFETAEEIIKNVQKSLTETMTGQANQLGEEFSNLFQDK